MQDVPFVKVLDNQAAVGLAEEHKDPVMSVSWWARSKLRQMSNLYKDCYIVTSIVSYQRPLWSGARGVNSAEMAFWWTSILGWTKEVEGRKESYAWITDLLTALRMMN